MKQSTGTKPQPAPDMKGRYSLWSAKYDLTFYGDTKEQCHEKLAEFDAKRNGQRVLKKSTLQTTVVGRADE